jgi:hypothetical protein
MDLVEGGYHGTIRDLCRAILEPGPCGTFEVGVVHAVRPRVAEVDVLASASRAPRRLDVAWWSLDLTVPKGTPIVVPIWASGHPR